jgi:hypothetical protein
MYRGYLSPPRVSLVMFLMSVALDTHGTVQRGWRSTAKKFDST